MYSVKLLCVTYGLVLLVNMASAVNPGAKMRITKKGIDYANTIAEAALRNDVKSLKIPDQSGDDHHLSWSLTNIQTESVSGPSSSIALNAGQGGLTWSLTNFGIDLKADWRVKYKKKWIKVSDSGSVSVGIKSVSLTVTVAIGDKDGRPSLSCKSCDAHIGGVDVHFHGGTAFILNLFKGVVEDKIKKILQSRICDLVTKEVNEDADAALAKMKVTVEIAHHFLLDYGLVAPAGVTENYLETLHKGELYWKDDKKECPFSPGPIPEGGDVGSMLYIWLTEYTAHTFAYTAHTHGYLKYNITQDDLPANHTSYLNTTCTGMCIGKLIPQIAKKCPNSWVELRVNSTQVPEVHMNNETISVGFWTDMEMFAHTPDAKIEYLLTLNVSLSVTIKPTIEDEKVMGSITDHSFDVGVLKSDVGELDPRVLKILLGGAIDLVVIPAFNSIGKKGLVLPVTGDVQFQNTQLHLIKDVLLLSTDVLYQKDFDTLRFVSEKQ